MFITVFLGILNIRTGEMLFSNAAHVPPLILKEHGPWQPLELPMGKPLGIARGSAYETVRLQLQPEEVLLVFTDGVTEAEHQQKGFFGDERLLSLLGTLGHPTTASHCVEAVFREVKKFSEGAPQTDDIAVLCIRYTGTETKSRASRNSLSHG